MNLNNSTLSIECLKDTIPNDEIVDLTKDDEDSLERKVEEVLNIRNWRGMLNKDNMAWWVSRGLKNVPQSSSGKKTKCGPKIQEGRYYLLQVNLQPKGHKMSLVGSRHWILIFPIEI